MAYEGDVFEGKTLEAAVKKGLDALHLSRAEVMITILEEGSSGFLGIGAKPCRVRVMRRPGGPPAVEPQDEGRRRRGPGRERRERGRGERRRERDAQPARGAGPERREERRGGSREERRTGPAGPGQDRFGDRRERREGRRRPDESGMPRRDERREEYHEEQPVQAGGPPQGADLGRAGESEGGEGRRRRRRGRRGGRRRHGGAEELRHEGARTPIESDAERTETFAEAGVPARPEAREMEEAAAETLPRHEPAAPAMAGRAEEPAPQRGNAPGLSAAELVEQSRHVTEDLLRAMGFEATVTATADGNHVEVTAEVARDEDLLTGRKGEVRQALQHLLNRMINRGDSSRYHLQLEINDFWKRREEELRALAHDLAGEALSSAGEVVTEYLNAQERRIVHMTLRDDARVKTYALGTGMIKRVAIAPADFAGGPRDEET